MVHIKKFDEINELHRGTWQNASDIAYKKGLGGLGAKFNRWGEEHGTGWEFPIKLINMVKKDEIILYPFVKSDNTPYFKIGKRDFYIARKVTPADSVNYQYNTKIQASVDDNLTFIAMFNQQQYKCKDRISAKNLIRAFSETLQKELNIDSRKLMYGY